MLGSCAREKYHREPRQCVNNAGRRGDRMPVYGGLRVAGKESRLLPS